MLFLYSHTIYFRALNIITFTQRTSILRAVWNLTEVVCVCACVCTTHTRTLGFH